MRWLISHAISAVKSETAHSTFEVPMVLVCDLRDGNLLRIREYFDLSTVVEGGTKHHLYA